jgi:hypothetical protein
MPTHPSSDTWGFVAPASGYDANERERLNSGGQSPETSQKSETSQSSERAANPR